MSDSATIQRLEELEAGRILGDLSGEEWDEWRALSKEHPDVLDGSLEWTAAQLESTLSVDESASPMPSGLTEKVKAGTESFVRPTEEATVVRPSYSFWNSAPVAWAAAAVLALLLVFSWTDRPGIESELASVDQSPDRVQSTFSGVGDYSDITGRVSWSDDLQKGYLSLEGIPVNDPTERQYQLWIVDPERDEAPVDGGVFDVVADAGTVRIPIDAKLRVDAPQAFVITLEKPGGVVKSNQKVVVALAKTS
ncbi:MAG: anti-sigma factor [Verrucomicrobiales bacterium]|nr:anti-sigma factor [Verrucomicrobiales bacterium]